MSKPKVLILDIETSPLITYTWGLWDQNIPLNMIKTDWFILSWSAKWLGEKTIYQMDQRHSKKLKNDKKILKAMWKLLDKADIIITQNGKKFDVKKLNTRFIVHGMQPPSSYKHIDTLQLAKKHFGFTSNKLEYMTNLLCTKYKKLVDRKFKGFDLWEQCLARNPRAWKEMSKYNKYDVLSLEELYTKLIPWDNSVNFNIYSKVPVCSCGSKEFNKNGYFYSSTGRFQRYSCKKCGSEFRDTKRDKSTTRIGTK